MGMGRAHPGGGRVHGRGSRHHDRLQPVGQQNRAAAGLGLRGQDRGQPAAVDPGTAGSQAPRLERYWQIIFALFILTVVVTLQRIFGYYMIKFMGVTDDTPAGWALPKLNESFVAISVIVILTLLSGGSLGSIYLQKGRLKLGLLIGLGVFALFALGGIPMASLFNAQDLSLARIVPWIPWLRFTYWQTVQWKR